MNFRRTLWCLALLLTYSNTDAQDNIIIELKQPANAGASVPIKFKRYKKGKLKKIKAKTMTVQVSTGKYKDERIIFPNNSDNLTNHQLKVIYNWSNQPTVWYDTMINVGYSGNAIANYSGRHGNDGKKKRGGRTGVLVIGRDGYDGKEGEDGENGINGENIEVELDVYYDSLLSIELLRAKVKSLSSLKAHTYLVDIKNGKLIIRSNGGDGGHGGKGGRGGDGKNAKAATEKKKAKAPGDGGKGGDGGNGGNGGNAGNITIYVKPSAEKYLNLVSTRNVAGRGGLGGDIGAPGDGGIGDYGFSDGEIGSQGIHGTSGFEGARAERAKIIYLKNKKE